MPTKNIKSTLYGTIQPINPSGKIDFKGVWDQRMIMFNCIESPTKVMSRISINLSKFQQIEFPGADVMLKLSDWCDGFEACPSDSSVSNCLPNLPPHYYFNFTSMPEMFIPSENKIKLSLTNFKYGQFILGGGYQYTFNEIMAITLPSINSSNSEFFSKEVLPLAPGYDYGSTVYGYIFIYPDITKLKVNYKKFKITVKLDGYYPDGYYSWVYASSPIPYPDKANIYTIKDYPVITITDTDTTLYYSGREQPLVTSNRLCFNLLNYTSVYTGIRGGRAYYRAQYNSTVNIAVTSPQAALPPEHGGDKRLQSTSLKSYNSLIADEFITIGEGPDLKPGDILVVYYIGAIGSLLTLKGSMYDNTLRGIAIQPTRLLVDNTLPRVFLEKPNGTSFPTDRVEAEYLGCNSPAFCVFKFTGVTQDQFENYNVVCYLRSNTSDVFEKAKIIEAQLAFVNI